VSVDGRSAPHAARARHEPSAHTVRRPRQPPSQRPPAQSCSASESRSASGSGAMPMAAASSRCTTTSAYLRAQREAGVQAPTLEVRVVQASRAGVGCMCSPHSTHRHTDNSNTQTPRERTAGWVT
jgi:hypothetical protein